MLQRPRNLPAFVSLRPSVGLLGAALLPLASLAGPAAAQTLEELLPPGSPTVLPARYTTTLLEDVDADGVRDFAVAYPDAQLRVFSGQDRSELYALPIESPPNQFADSVVVATIGDWDGDGLGDLAVASPSDGMLVAVHSASSGLLLAELANVGGILSPAGAEGVGDVDGDAVSDFVVASRDLEFEVRSGSDGSLLEAFVLDSGHITAWLDGSRDFNGDGRRDLVIGSLDPNTLFGDVRILSLPSGSELLRLATTDDCDTCGFLGTTVVATQDLDGDTQPDLVTSFIVSKPSGLENRVAAYSSVSANQLWATPMGLAQDNWVTNLELVGDYDGDGQPDLLSTSPRSETSGPGRGRVSILSSATGRILRSFYGTSNCEFFGTRIASLGDPDGDGREEAVVASSGTGALRVFDLGTTGSVNCFATLNSTGQRAQLSAAGSLDVDVNEFQLVAAPVPDRPGLFFYGPSSTQVPFGNGVRCVGGFLTRLEITQPVAGVLWNSIDFADPPSAMGQITAGSTVYFQAWFRDPGMFGAGFNLSDSLEVTYLP